MIKQISIFIVMILAVAGVQAGPNVRPPDIDGPGGISGGGGGPGPPGIGIAPVTSDLLIYTEIDCYDADRHSVDGEDPRNVVFRRTEWHDGPSSPDPSYQYYLAYGFHDYAAWAPEPGTILNYNFTNQSFVRYEGRNQGNSYGCYAYGRVIHHEYTAGVFNNTFDTDWVLVPSNQFYQEIDWDNTQSQCEILGGAWLSGGSYDDYRCCGDDWIWIHNLPIRYDLLSTVERYAREDANDLCLYSNIDTDPGTDDYGFGIDGETYGLPTGSYICDNALMGHVDYDDTLRYDDPEVTLPSLDDPFFFFGKGSTETDLGIWSDINDENPMFCDMDFVHAAGEGVKFEWIPFDTAAQEQVICQAYLGLNWTGTQCCGAPGAQLTYSDTLAECNGQQVYGELLSQYGESFLSHPGYKSKFMENCTNYMTIPKLAKLYKTNHACYENITVRNNTKHYAGLNATVFNDEGQLLLCEGATNTYGLPTRSKCSTAGDLAVCTYRNDSWYTKSDTHSYDILGYRDVYNTKQEIIDSIHDSTMPSEVLAAVNFNQTQECCFTNACWDGNLCAGEGAMYELHNNKWKMYDEQFDPAKDIYMCEAGSWNGPLDPTYNWYWDTEHPGYCPRTSQCYCSDSAKCHADYFMGSSGGGCTELDSYYYDNFVCEDGDWTSRSKILATQMMDIAGSNDYTIFCDKIENAVNFYEPLVPVKDSLNGICVLNYNDEVVLGMSFNAETTDPFDLDLDAVLFSDQSIVPTILEETLANCDDAVSGASTSGHGSFKKCISGSSKFYYNNKTQLFIYAKEGLTGDPLTWSYSSRNSDIQGYFSAISSHISTYAATINAHPDIMNIEVFENANKYSSIYIAKSGGNTVFGLLEELYDHDWDDTRSYMGMLYRSVGGVECSEIEAADLRAYCGKSGTDVIVIERNTGPDFPYWTDLSAKIRFK